MPPSLSIPSSALIMGLGRFGGGLGITKYLLSQGLHVTITDIRVAEEFIDPLHELQPWIDSAQLTLRLGGHKIEDFESAELLVVNPAIKPWASNYIKAATKAGARITSEIVMAIERLPSPNRTIAITGTLGKSTTASMIHHAMQELAIRSHLGGNIGGSLLNSLDHIHPDDWIILELSSAQLYWLNEACSTNWSPHIAIVTNFQPNHLDWHNTAEHYEQCKRSLCAHQSQSDTAILPESLRDWASPDAQLQTIDESLDHWPTDIELCVPGNHNRRNAVAALLALESALPTVSRADIACAIASFPGLPYRLEFIGGTTDRVRFFNDSKSSTPDAAVVALQAVNKLAGATGRIHLLAGGYDKGLDLAPVVNAIPAKRLMLHAFGSTQNELCSHARSNGIEYSACTELERAFHDVMRHLQRGDIVLLSPACASWDQFSNYEERGDWFTELAQKVLGQLPA